MKLSNIMRYVPDDVLQDVVPLLLMTFVENAFKYGTSNHQDSQISINLHTREDSIVFSCCNKIFDSRLEHLYAGKYVTITNDNQCRQVLVRCQWGQGPPTTRITTTKNQKRLAIKRRSLFFAVRDRQLALYIQGVNRRGNTISPVGRTGRDRTGRAYVKLAFHTSRLT